MKVGNDEQRKTLKAAIEQIPSLKEKINVQLPNRINPRIHYD